MTTPLAPGFVRAKQKGKGGTVVLHRRDVTAEYKVVDPNLDDPTAELPTSGAANAADAASQRLDEDRAYAERKAAIGRAQDEADSLKRRDAQADTAKIKAQGEADAAVARAVAAKKPAATDTGMHIASDGRAPADIKGDKGEKK